VIKDSYSKYFPTPKFLTMSSFALDISDHSIKYGTLDISSDGLELVSYGKEVLPDGILKSGKIIDSEALISCLKKIKEKEGMEFVRVGLPEEQVYLFTLSLPNVQGINISEAILLQLEDHIPLPAVDALFDYEVLSETDSFIELSVVCVSSEIVEHYLYALDKAGLFPVSFEFESQSIVSAVIPRGDTGTAMVIDFGETHTGISIAVNGKVVFSSTFSIGGNAFTEMIARYYGISHEEAEKKKNEFDEFSAQNQDDLFLIVLNVVAVLRDELNKHFSYWSTHKGEKGEAISKIILCGGGANIPGLIRYLAVSFKVQVEYANAWINISNMNKSVPSMPLKESLSYTTMLGLALSDFLYD
jgi:type IV pilus assembly protein PilM